MKVKRGDIIQLFGCEQHYVCKVDKDGTVHTLELKDEVHSFSREEFEVAFEEDDNDA